MSNAPLLVIENLTKYFNTAAGQLHAVDGVSFTLEEGKTLGIVGESGCGKSTTGRCILKLIEPTSGKIIFQGNDITKLSRKEMRPLRQKMQMVFQTPTDSFDPRRTLGDGIGESLRNAGMPKKEARSEVKRLLEACGLPAEFADRYPHQVSGGQCQRAAIARALAVKPKLLICDEATSALDVTVQKEILNLLNALRSQQGDNLSILFICHDISLVQQFCDRVVVMYHGSIVEQGTPDAVIGHPQNAYTQRLIDSVI